MIGRRLTVAILLALFAGLAHAAQTRRDTAPPCKYEQNCECAAPGITARWKAAYCMASNETDDLENDAVQRCLARPAPASLNSRSACRQNAYWKQMICRSLHKNSKKAIDACIRDKKMIPRIVEHGQSGVL